MTASRRWIVALGASGLAVTACARRGSPPPTGARTTGAELGSTSNDDAVVRVATARCERELACNKIGRGRAYEDMPACLERIGALMNEEVGRSACPAGVDPLSVSSCLLDIRTTPCGGALEAHTNLPSCERTALCSAPYAALQPVDARARAPLPHVLFRGGPCAAKT